MSGRATSETWVPKRGDGLPDPERLEGPAADAEPPAERPHAASSRS